MEDDDAPAQKRDRESDCLCQKSSEGNNCIWFVSKAFTCMKLLYHVFSISCLDFNISDTFDLGPACVRMKYLSQTDGIAMNLTLGKTLSKSSIVKISNPEEPVCLSMLGGLAKMCAKFAGLAPSANGGLIGCLAMQPKLFGEVPIAFDFPCFSMDEQVCICLCVQVWSDNNFFNFDQEIRIIEAPKKSQDDNKEEAASTDSEEIGGFKVSDILNLVSNSADQGIKIISELFGIKEDEKPEAATPDAESKTISEDSKNVTKNN